MNYDLFKLIGTGITIVLFLLISISAFPQTTVDLSVNQPAELVADAGEDATINVDDDIVLGGIPAASGGTSPYSYYWNWQAYLDDRTLPNPLATPTGTMTFTVVVTDANGCTDSDAVTITVEGGSGIFDVESGIRFNIYPNPTSGSFTIDINNITQDKEMKISILSLSGRRVYEEIFKINGRLEEEINISGWPRGSYIIRIDGESIHFTRQLILH
jgi:hypothetical protein